MQAKRKRETETDRQSEWVREREREREGRYNGETNEKDKIKKATDDQLKIETYKRQISDGFW